MPDFSAVLDLGSLDGQTGFRIDGLAAGDMIGRSLYSIGDINQDGFADFIIGAPGADPGGDLSAGAAYVVFGGSSFGATFGLGGLDGTNGFRIDGVTAGDLLGGSSSAVTLFTNTAVSAGDFNDDGFIDLIVGAGLGDPDGRGNAGYAYVVFGSDDPWSASVDLGSLTSSQGFRINGALAGDSAGYSVSGAGDINGDGIADIVIGARGADPNGANSGTTYVVFGSAGLGSADIELSALDGTNGFALHGASGQSGYSVASAGDFASARKLPARARVARYSGR